jgi:hypothetical protein
MSDAASFAVHGVEIAELTETKTIFTKVVWGIGVRPVKKHRRMV